ncbi:MAG: hypothetical protein VSS75_001315 [Candidatus Parabeggiatoa sp.]|nr:hypothetical protein [Candidatus Parabeggiatoa sp.]
MSQKLARSLVIILLIPYSLFIIEFLAKEVTFQNIIKVIAAVSGPLPLAIFIAYIFVAKENLLAEIDETRLNVFTAFSYLLATCLISILCLYFFEAIVYKELSHSVVPIFLNSFVLSLYIVNILWIKRIKMIAILSGISMGISIYVLFI